MIRIEHRMEQPRSSNQRRARCAPGLRLLPREPELRQELLSIGSMLAPGQPRAPGGE